MRSIRMVTAILAAGLMAAATSGQTAERSDAVVDSECEMASNPVTEIGIRRQFDSTIPIDPPIREIDMENAKYIRVLVKVEDVGSCDWYLTVRNEQHRVVQTMTREDFRNTKTRWTMRVLGHLVKFELQRCGNNVPAVSLVQYIAMPDEPKNTYYSLRNPGQPAYFPLFNLATGVRSLGDPVGLLMNSYLEDSWTCSGVMVTSDLFLTNWHCGGLSSFRRKQIKFWDKEVIGDSLIDLSWDDDESSREYVGVGEVVAESEKLDFALIDVRPVNSVGRARPAILSDTPVGPNAKLKIIHHPVALSKRITMGCFVITPSRAGWRDAEEVDFAHDCDTEAGSSGAPIFDERGYVVGLHHLGFAYDKNCKEKDGVNKAVRMDKILAFLRLKHRRVYDLLQVRK